MKYLFKKDLIIFFSSPLSFVVFSIWFLVLSLMLWLFKGEYNLPDGGYATLSPFFSIASKLLLLFVATITMKLFSEEKRSGTIKLLVLRPISLSKIVFSKFLIACFLSLLALVPTLIYAFSIQAMSNVGLDVGELIGGYLGLFCLVLVFSSIGIFVSSLTSNQLISFLLAVFLSFVLFYGFDLLSSLYSNGILHNRINDWGINAHYQSIIRGVIDSRDLFYFLSIAYLFLLFTFFALNHDRYKSLLVKSKWLIFILLFLSLISNYFYFRYDLTEDKRYSLSKQSKELIRNLNASLEIIFYLDGELNPSFERLKTATIDLLEEFAQYTKSSVRVIFKDPNAVIDEMSKQQLFMKLEERGMTGISVNERDNKGKLSSQIIFPWLELIYDGDTIPVSLLKNNINSTPQNILNSSIGELEYSLTDALRLLTIKDVESIAFIEGHDELDEPYISETIELLSKYYNIDRGKIEGNPEQLIPYKLLIIAAPKKSFTEAEKFALDQYLMNGGNLLFLLDGIQISDEEFNLLGESATLKSDVNLDDLLFVYGIRINPVVIQDLNCTSIRLASSQEGAKESYITVPWYFAPLLEPNQNHTITRNISPLKSELVSSISWINTEYETNKVLLLSSSSNAHTLSVPEKVSLRYVEMPADERYFNESYLPVAGLMEGVFRSAFVDREIPQGAHLPINMQKLNESQTAKIIVVASSSVIKNDVVGQGQHAQTLPLGYDRITGEQLGNSDFMINSVHYLTGNEQWLSLRTRNLKLRLLNKQDITINLVRWQIQNIGLPQFIVWLACIIFLFYRKKRNMK